MSENPFHALKKQSVEAWKADTENKFESSHVHHTFQRLKLDVEERALRKELKEQDLELLTFRAFNSRFPTFPIALSCSRNMAYTDRKGNVVAARGPLHTLAEAVHPQWFKKFMSLPFMYAYREIWDSMVTERAFRPLGMVFPRKGFQQGLIVHNGDVEKFVPAGSSCHLYVGGGDKKMSLVVQPFTGLLDHIHDKGNGWKPS